MPEATPYIIVRWNDGCNALRRVGNYLARSNGDGTADILRIVEPGEDARLLELIHANAARDAALAKTVARTRAQIAAARTPPAPPAPPSAPPTQAGLYGPGNEPKEPSGAGAIRQ